MFVDIDGDGKADAIAMRDSGIVVSYSDGAKFLPPVDWIMPPRVGFGSRGTFILPRRGAGAELVILDDHGITIRRQQLSASDAYWPDYLQVDSGNRGTFFPDLKGKGQSALVMVREQFGMCGIVVRQMVDHSGFGREELTTVDPPCFGTRATAFEDVDGDRRADAIFVNDDSIFVRLNLDWGAASSFAGFGLATNWTPTGGPTSGTNGTFFADVDGDGRVDVVLVQDDGVWVRRSSRGQFLPPERWTNDPFFGSRGTFFVDVDGDGLADAIAVNEDAVYVRRAVKY
jgi:hypothetical protein